MKQTFKIGDKVRFKPGSSLSIFWESLEGKQGEVISSSYGGQIVRVRFNVKTPFGDNDASLNVMYLEKLDSQYHPLTSIFK